MDLKAIIRTIPDFPKEGVIFRDITPILHNSECLRSAVSQIESRLKDISFDLILGPESRGFIFGMPVAYSMGKGFVPVRKEGKLPAKTIKKSYDLEYGSATIEIHADAISPGQKVVIIDDLLATGGTCKAICEMVTEMGGIIEGIVFLIELEALNGREHLKNYNVSSILQY